MSIGLDLGVDLFYMTSMSVVACSNIWLVSLNYRRCLKQLEEGGRSAAVRRDLGNLAANAMSAFILAVVAGFAIAGAHRELGWAKAVLLAGIFAFTCVLYVRLLHPLRQFIRRGG